MRKAACFLVLLLLVAEATPASASSQNSADHQFSLAVAERTMATLRAALLAQNRSRTLSLFDRNMPGLEHLSGELASLFSRYDTLRVYARITQTAPETTGGVAMVDFTLEAIPPDSSYLPVRRNAELRFIFGRVGKEWKIVNLEPRNFFAQF